MNQRVGSIIYPDISDIMASTGSRVEVIAEEVPSADDDQDDTLFVAVGKDVKENEMTLNYSLHTAGGECKICIIHVHAPAKMIPLNLMGTKFLAEKMEAKEVRAYRELERQQMDKLLEYYLLICRRQRVRADKQYIESDCIEKGIVELISRHGIRKLVLGAAADKHYSSKMVDLKSKKAIYVRRYAPAFCQIQFICQGKLIYTRESSSNTASYGSDNAELVSSPSPQQVHDDHQNTRSEALTIAHRRSRSLTVLFTSQSTSNRLKSPINLNPSCQGLSRSRSVVPFGSSRSDSWVNRFRHMIISVNRPGVEPQSSPSDNVPVHEGHNPTPSCSLDINSQGPPCNYECVEKNSAGFAVQSQSKHSHHSSLPLLLRDRSMCMDDSVYEQLQIAMSDAANARREALEEAIKRGNAEKNAIEVLRWVKVSESSYQKECMKRKEVEEELVREKHKLETAKNEIDQLTKELQNEQNKRCTLEIQIAESDRTAEELEQKIVSAAELLKKYKAEKDELQIQCDSALKKVEALLEEKPDNTMISEKFSFSEIEEATRNFDPSMQIGEGGYGSIYKGLLRHTEVAIKVLNPDSSQGPSEFQQEVEILSKIRHPNIVTLIGTCPESYALIYDYLPNGSLEDRLMISRKNNTPPLSYQSRIRIATELCSALIFLHSSEPHPIIHGDLKPSNILLDSNNVTKLGDFGISRLLSSRNTISSDASGTRVFHRTDRPRGTFAYIDPEFMSSGEVTTKSDVYSFGIILLRLLCGRQAVGIRQEVEYALQKEKLMGLLDCSVGEWPFVQAQMLARLGLQCSDLNRRNRPDLGDVWRVLVRIRWACCGGPLSSRFGSLDQPVPACFFCPIFQEIMQDPHVAADGYTYEREAIKGWFDGGRDTSPKTHRKLDHLNLVPNHTVRLAIQEWLHAQQR